MPVSFYKKFLEICLWISAGIVSGAILQLRSEFQLDCIKQEMVVSSMLMGAVLASLSGGTSTQASLYCLNCTVETLLMDILMSSRGFNEN